MNWISIGKTPASSTPLSCRTSLTGNTVRSASPEATMPLASAPRAIGLTLILSAIPSRGNKSFMSQMPEVLCGTVTSLGVAQRAFDGIDGAEVRLRRSRTNADANTYRGKINVRADSDAVGRDQAVEPFA